MPAVIIPPRGINKKVKFSRLDHIIFLELVIEADRSGTPAGFSPVLFSFFLLIAFLNILNMQKSESRAVRKRYTARTDFLFISADCFIYS